MGAGRNSNELRRRSSVAHRAGAHQPRDLHDDPRARLQGRRRRWAHRPAHAPHPLPGREPAVHGRAHPVLVFAARVPLPRREPVHLGRHGRARAVDGHAVRVDGLARGGQDVGRDVQRECSGAWDLGLSMMTRSLISLSRVPQIWLCFLHVIPFVRGSLVFGV